MSHKCSIKKHNSHEFTAEQSCCNPSFSIGNCFLVAVSDADAISCGSKLLNFEIIASFSVSFNILCLRVDFFAGSLCSSTRPSSLRNFLFFGGGSSRDDSKMSEFHDILAETLVEAKPSV